jgi:hypothetical protein
MQNAFCLKSLADAIAECILLDAIAECILLKRFKRLQGGSSSKTKHKLTLARIANAPVWEGDSQSLEGSANSDLLLLVRPPSPCLLLPNIRASTITPASSRWTARHLQLKKKILISCA